jgi:predicted esterase
MSCVVRRSLYIALIFACLATEAAAHMRRGPTIQHVVQVAKNDLRSSCGSEIQAGGGSTVEETILRGVPVIVRTPAVITQPPVILLHGFGQPATAADLMRALPLDDVPAVKVYLWLPLFGPRAAPGGRDELVRRQKEDFVSLLFEPAVIGAAHDLPGIIEELRTRHCLGKREGVRLFGFSAGGSAVLYALVEKRIPVRAAVILNTPPNLDATISALERTTGHDYRWSTASRQIAGTADAVRHARDIASGKLPPALLIVQGADDSLIGTQGAMTLERALRPHYHSRNHDDRLQVTVAPGVSHEWTGSPELESIRTRTSTWFNLPWE